MDGLSSRANEPAVTITRLGAVALIRLNRPSVLNAVNRALATDLAAALTEVDEDPTCQVGVVTGSGRGFCAGADLRAIAVGERLDADGHPEWGFGGFVSHPISKPLIAAVNGPALGGGMELVLACDLAIMSESAYFGLPEVRRGVIAGAGGLIHLPRQVPMKIAMEIVLTGDRVPAERALQLGLVNKVVPAAALPDSALALATQIAQGAPLSLRASRRMVRASLAAESAWDRELWGLQKRQLEEVFASHDCHEGATAFHENRAPAWRGE